MKANMQSLAAVLADSFLCHTISMSPTVPPMYWFHILALYSLPFTWRCKQKNWRMTVDYSPIFDAMPKWLLVIRRLSKIFFTITSFCWIWVWGLTGNEPHYGRKNSIKYMELELLNMWPITSFTFRLPVLFSTHISSQIVVLEVSLCSSLNSMELHLIWTICIT